MKTRMTNLAKNGLMLLGVVLAGMFSTWLFAPVLRANAANRPEALPASSFVNRYMYTNRIAIPPVTDPQLDKSDS